MNYLDDYRRIPWLLSRPVSRESLEEEELEEEEDIDYPVWKKAAVWGSFPRERRYIIIKMEAKFLDSAADFLQKHFFTSDILCKGVNLMKEEVAVDYYKELMRYWMRDRTTLLAIEEGNERLVGVLVARIIYLVSGVNLDIDYSRICICNQRVQEIQDLRVNMRKEIIKVTTLERAEDKCFEIKLISVDPIELIADDIERRLIRGLYVLACEANISLLIAVVTSSHQQKHFRAERFKTAFAAKYEDLKKREHVIFPSKAPNTSVVGFFKYLEGVYRSAYVEPSTAPKPVGSDELLFASLSEDSLTDPEREPLRMIHLYLDYDKQQTYGSYSSLLDDESYKDVNKLIQEYHEEMSGSEEGSEFSEFSECEDEFEFFEQEQLFFGE